MLCVPYEKLFARRRSVNQQLDEVVSCEPGVFEKFAASLLELRREVVAKRVKRKAQRRAPALVPALRRTAVTTAVARPAPKPVRTTPCSALAARLRFDSDFGLRLVRREELAVVHHAKAVALGFGFERVCYTAV